MRAIWRVLALSMLAVAMPLAPASAQSDFPTKPVTIVVPFAAGGPSDVFTRLLGEELTKIWKQQVVIENRGGGGTVIGTALVANARPDGYTLEMVSGSFTINAAARTGMPYDTLRDFATVATFMESPLAMVAHPNLGVSSLPELVAAAKKSARAFTFASPGTGSPAHMAGELLQRKTGITLKHISYGGEAAAIPDVLSGRVDLYFGTWANQRPHVEAGKLKPLAMMFATRVPEAPQVPTATEAIPGIGLPLSALSYIVAPAKVPPALVKRISADIRTALEAATFRDKVLSLGSYPRYMDADETNAFIRKEIAVWTEIAAAAGIKLE